ncbi:hypothetical protein BGY98DRAFT_233536 [Russula aff. rugulosa BPL654]|nr:hypothetical protein BGY98DRAFT_233536 [Russula aff. rugulosa BPL654]
MGHAALGEQVSASQPLVSRCCQYFASAHHLSLSANPVIIQTTNDCISQCVDIQLKILQTLLSFITNFPTILTDYSKTYVLSFCSLFLDGWTGPRCDPFFVSGCMN